MSDVCPLSGISGLSFDSTFLLHLVLLLFPSCHFSCNGPFSRLENILNFLVKRCDFLYSLCWAARRSYLVCAACCYMALVFAAMHLYCVV